MFTIYLFGKEGFKQFLFCVNKQFLVIIYYKQDVAIPMEPFNLGFDIQRTKFKIDPYIDVKSGRPNLRLQNSGSEILLKIGPNPNIKGEVD